MPNEDGQYSREGDDKQKRPRKSKTLADLRLQEVVKDKRIEIQKVGTKFNPADLMTKHLDSKTAVEHLKRLSARTATGWHELAPKL